MDLYIPPVDYYICILNEETKIYVCEDDRKTKYDKCFKMYNILLCEWEGIEV